MWHWDNLGCQLDRDTGQGWVAAAQVHPCPAGYARGIDLLGQGCVSEEIGRGCCPNQQQHPRTCRKEEVRQVRQTGVRLLPAGLAVAWRTTAANVGTSKFRSGNPVRGKQLFQCSPRLSGKAKAEAIFFRARCLADGQQSANGGCGKDNLVAGGAKRGAAGAFWGGDGIWHGWNNLSDGIFRQDIAAIPNCAQYTFQARRLGGW